MTGGRNRPSHASRHGRDRACAPLSRTASFSCFPASRCCLAASLISFSRSLVCSSLSASRGGKHSALVGAGRQVCAGHAPQVSGAERHCSSPLCCDGDPTWWFFSSCEATSCLNASMACVLGTCARSSGGDTRTGDTRGGRQRLRSPATGRPDVSRKQGRSCTAPARHLGSVFAATGVLKTWTVGCERSRHIIGWCWVCGLRLACDGMASRLHLTAFTQ
jgi:hypothetical protein